jgi:regulator of nonsense transcripts 1
MNDDSENKQQQANSEGETKLDLTDEQEEEEQEESSSSEEENNESLTDDDDDSLEGLAPTVLPLDPYDESNLPYCACRYCGIHDASAVAKCAESQKWFCNTHLIHHLVRSRSFQVQLHPESPLGDTILECYNCAGKNVFVLGFVPARGSSVVVLLCRVCVETVPALQHMDWELTQWLPLIQDRAFLPWLIAMPSDTMLARARAVTPAQMQKLEELWKTEPEATFCDLGRPERNGDVEADLLPQTLTMYEDGFHYQNIIAPLVKVEADYDRHMKESLTEESVQVRWDKSLAGKSVAVFSFHRMQVELSRIVVGDELRLKLGPGGEFVHGRPWEGVGYVKNMMDGQVELELRTGGNNVPEQLTEDYAVEYIWKSTSFDRMQSALKTFAIDDTSVTGYIYHKLLGHPVKDQLITNVKLPAKDRDFNAPGLPPLNESQANAVAAVLQRPLSLIQGPPGTVEY